MENQILKSVDILKVARKYVKLKKKGNRYVGLCPFHKEKNPSFAVDKENQLFHCYGCGISGDAITLIMEKEKMTFPQAIEFLAREYKLKIERGKDPIPHEVRAAIFKLMQLNELNDIIMEWIHDKCSDKFFIGKLFIFEAKLQKIQNTIINWKESLEIQKEFWDQEDEDLFFEKGRTNEEDYPF